MLRAPDISQNSAHIVDRRGAEESSEESSDHDRLDVFGDSSGE
jgi:hypothetical protein